MAPHKRKESKKNKHKMKHNRVEKKAALVRENARTKKKASKIRQTRKTEKKTVVNPPRVTEQAGIIVQERIAEKETIADPPRAIEPTSSIIQVENTEKIAAKVPKEAINHEPHQMDRSLKNITKGKKRPREESAEDEQEILQPKSKKFRHDENDKSSDDNEAGSSCTQTSGLDLGVPTDDDCTKLFFLHLIASKTAMQCPQCGIMIMKDGGCDFVECAVCKLGICFLTQKPRHRIVLPDGRFIDGCHCMEGGVKCHPQCKNCH